MRPYGGLHHGAHGYRIEIVDDPRRKKKKGGYGKITGRPPSRRQGAPPPQRYQYAMEERYEPTRIDKLRALRANDPYMRPIPQHVQTEEQLRTYEMVQENIDRARLTGRVQGAPQAPATGKALFSHARRQANPR